MDDPLFEPIHDYYGEVSRWTAEEAGRVPPALERMETEIRKTPQGLAVGCLQALKELQEIYENALTSTGSDASRRQVEAVLGSVRGERAAIEAGMAMPVWFEGMDVLSLPAIRRCLSFLSDLRTVCAAAARENLPVEILPD